MLGGTNAAAASQTRKVAAHVLDQILVLLHPFMPFMTEELSDETGALGRRRQTLLIDAAWPPADGLGDAVAAAEDRLGDRLVSEIPVGARRNRMSRPAPASHAWLRGTPGGEAAGRYLGDSADRRWRGSTMIDFALRAPGTAQIGSEGALARYRWPASSISPRTCALGKELDKPAEDMAATSRTAQRSGLRRQGSEE